MASLTRRAARLTLLPAAVLLLAGCSSASSSAGDPGTTSAGDTATITSGAASATATVACPTAAEFKALVIGAFGDQAADGRVTGQACTDGWAAAGVELPDRVTGRIALRLTDGMWNPVLVGGAGGPCPASVKDAPEQIRSALSC